MKLFKSYMAAAACAVLALASCSEGQYWNEPESKGNVVAFPKPAVELKIAPGATAPDSYTVTVFRSGNLAEESIPVTVEVSDASVLSAPETITFANGADQAEYVIKIGQIIPGVTYKATVSLPSSESFTHADSQNLKFSFSISQELVWTSAGEAMVQSLGWAGAVGQVQVEEANWPVAGQRLFRLVDVYYALEPQYVSDKNVYIRFYTDDQGKALRMGDSWSYIGERTDDGGYYFFGLNGSQGTFTSEGNIYTMDGFIASGSTLSGPSSLNAYETIVFQWDCPAK